MMGLSYRKRRKLSTEMPRSQSEVYGVLINIWNLFIKQARVLVQEEYSNKLRCEPASRIQEITSQPSAAKCFLQFITTIRFVIIHLKRRGLATVRELYYQDIAIFDGRQPVFFQCLQKLAFISSTTIEKELRIYPTTKSLVFGGPDIRISRNGLIHHRFYFSKEPELIPRLCWSDDHSIEGLEAVVLIEKDSFFMAYCKHLAAEGSNRKIMAVTGKGYPDILAREFLDNVSRRSPDIPIFAFMDADVHGLRIYNTYKYASESLRQNLIYGGVFLLDYTNGCVTMQKKDFKLMISMKRNIASKTYGLGDSPRDELMLRELYRGMLLHKKAEMNTLNDQILHNNLIHYVNQKISLFVERAYI